jgi:DNA-binding MarR family transcriptional regulator
MPDKQLQKLLEAADDEVIRTIRQALQRQGISLTVSEFRILESVREHGAISMGEIARYNHVSPGTLSIEVRRLIRKGYLRQRHDPKDKRIVTLKCTDEADAVLDMMQNRQENVSEQALQGLNEQDRQAFLGNLEKVLENLRKIK